MHTTPRTASADLHVLFRPAVTFREMARHRSGGQALFRLSSFLLVLGCTVSLLGSGRLSVRLIADGAVSFAFLPAFVVAGLAAVYFSRADRRLPFARALDFFSTGLLPWLLWLVGLSAVCSIVPPRQLGPWIWPLEISLLVPAAWSCVIDFHFFREAMGLPARAALRDLALNRVVAWGGATAYFLGIAIYYEIVPVVIKWIRG
jgi:hypothetical protein